MAWINKPFQSALFRMNVPATVVRPLSLQSTTGPKTTPSCIYYSTTTRSIEKGPNLSSLPFRTLPGPSFLGNIKTIKKEGIDNLHRIQENAFEKYGPIFKVTMPDMSVYVYTSDPDDCEQVFRADKFPSLRPNVFSFPRYFLDKGLPEGVLGNDEHAIRHRSTMVQNILRPVEIQNLVAPLFDVSRDSTALLNDGRNKNLLRHFQKWATESIGFVTFGHRVGVNLEYPNETMLAFIDAVCEFLEIERQLMHSLPIFKFFMIPTFKRLYRAVDTLWDVTNEHIKQAKEQQLSSLEGKPIGFLQKVLQDNPQNLSEQEICQLMLTMFGGGVGTVAYATVNVLYNLSQFPEVQKTLYKEISHALPNNNKPTRENLDQMPYLKAVIKESHRVTPTSPAAARQLREPIVLGGYEIPTKAVIVFSSFPAKATAKQVFGDFENFRPERWLRETAATLHPFASIPFGYGLRMCPGRRIAEMEMSTLLINILQRFEIERSDLAEDKMGWKFNVAMVPDKPFNLNLKERA